jgi:hypothetical protein
MLLTSTVAYEGMPKERGFSVKGIAILAAGLVLGAAIGFAIANFTSTTDAPTASAVVVEAWTVDPHFLEMNVGSFESLALAGSAVVVEPWTVDPHFWEANVGSFEGLALAGSAVVVEPRAVDPHFWEANVESLEYLSLSYTEPSSGPR